MTKWKPDITEIRRIFCSSGFILFSLFISSFSAKTDNLRYFNNNTVWHKKNRPVARAVSFSFTILRDANTSAGVFSVDGTLIKTLWSGIKYNAGTYQRWWDGTTDDGELAPNGNYHIKVLSNNVKYTWEGVIGNSSDVNTGPNVHQGMEAICSMAFSANKGFYTNNYNEQRSSCFSFNITNPQKKTSLLGWGLNAKYVATDGRVVYWAGNDPFNAKRWMVCGTAVADDAEVSFGEGIGYSTRIARKYRSVIDTVGHDNADISGLAVQKTGRFLFVSHAKLNELHVLDKTSGQLLQILKYNSPASLAVDANDQLWMVYNNNAVKTVARFAVNQNGQLSVQNLVLADLINPLALAVSPDNRTLLVADGGTSQQIKAFSNSSGIPLWTLGQKGGYANDPNVTNDKFYFSDLRATYDTFVAFQPDGSFWVEDCGNSRAQHYAADRSFINNIQYLIKSYNTRADPNNPSRLFSDYLEFKIDYSKPLAPDNNSWKLIKNWGFQVLPPNDDEFDKLKCIATLSNNRTYALSYNHFTRKWVVIELPPSGSLRATGIELNDDNTQLYPDGNLYRMSRFKPGKPTTWTKRLLTGFDASNNPLWSDETIIASSTPATSEDPAYWGNKITLKSGEITSTGVIVAFDGGLPPNGGNGFHLGGIKLGDTKWLWRTAMSTPHKYQGPYPADGTYDVGNGSQYGGSVALVSGQNIIWGFHGEFYKGSEVNKWNHVNDDGLFIGQFGAVGHDLGFDAPAMMAGNSFSASLVKTSDGGLYLYHNDESYHSGVHRWKITGLSSIQEQVIPVVLAVTAQGLLGRYYNGADLDNLKQATARTDRAVNFNLRQGAPVNTGIIDNHNFSIAWTGFIVPLYSEEYAFFTGDSAKTRLWVNGRLMAGNLPGIQGSLAASAINLVAGHRYPLRMEYTGGQMAKSAGTIKLAWSSRSQPMQIVPAAQLVSPLVADPAAQGFNLLQDLPYNGILENNRYGWKRDPADEINKNRQSDLWNVQTNVKSYAHTPSPDLFIAFRLPPGSATVTRNLSMNKPVSSWKLSGNINFEGHYFNSDGDLSENGSGGSFIDVNDDHNNKIARLFIHVDYPTRQVQIIVNGKKLAQGDFNIFRALINASQPLSISASNGTLLFKYGNFPQVSALPFDPGANVLKPTTLVFYFWMKSSSYDRVVDLEKLFFQVN
jgi:hypothetical protein